MQWPTTLIHGVIRLSPVASVLPMPASGGMERKGASPNDANPLGA